MLRGTVMLCTALAAGAAVAQPRVGEFEQHCSGPADDGQGFFDVDVYLDEYDKARRVILVKDDAEMLADFLTFDDLTPKPPTDERYRYVFREDGAGAGDLALMLMDGGFTQHLTAQIWLLTDDEPVALATLNCVR